MAITQKSRWDDVGVEPPAGEARYAAGEQPIAEYDNWFNKAVVDDIAALNAWLDNLGITKVYIDAEANKPASGKTTELFIATDTNKIYRGTGTGWQELTVDWNAILNKPSTFPSKASQFTVDASLIPNTDNAYDLGSSSLRWRNGYFVNIDVGDIVLKNGMIITERGDDVIIKNAKGEVVMIIENDGGVVIGGE